MYEHFNNTYRHREDYFDEANPFLCHPDEVKYRQYGARVTDALGIGELMHAGTPFEVDLKAHTAKFMKHWEVIKTEASGTNTVITLAAHWLAPGLIASDVIMVVPASISGTGKALAAGAVTRNEDDNTMSVTVVTANFDTVKAGDFISIAEEAGSGKSLAVKGNAVLARDLYAGAQNFVDIPRGELYCYVNTCNGIPAAVIAAAREIGLFIEPEYFAENA